MLPFSWGSNLLILNPGGEESQRKRGLARVEAGQRLPPVQRQVGSGPGAVICAILQGLLPDEPTLLLKWQSPEPLSYSHGFCPTETSDF